MYALILMILLVLGTGAATPAKVNWTDVVTVGSVVVNVVFGVLLWLVNRKREADQELRKKNQEQLDDATVRIRDGEMVRKQLITQVDHIEREIVSLKAAVGASVGDAEVSEIRGDCRSMKRDLEDARISLAGHQNICADRFVHRTSYSEDQRAQRETVNLIHELIKQQRDIIERIRL